MSGAGAAEGARSAAGSGAAPGAAAGASRGDATGTASDIAAAPHARWHEAFIGGLSLWTPDWPGWETAAAALLAERPESAAHAAERVIGHGSDTAQTAAASATAPHETGRPAHPPRPARPAPTSLAANERRRAPDSVLVALQVAEQAVAMSGHAAASLASVFTSAHGDLPIVDALARTLAGDPTLLSPTRFHHSVHNAPSGYWAIASGSHAASTALAAYDHSFGAGLLEALVQVACEGAPVLLAGCDTGAEGPLASVNTSRGLLGVALVLAARPGPSTRWRLRWLVGAAGHADAEPGSEIGGPIGHPISGPIDGPLVSPLGQALATNAQADALPLFEALAALEQRHAGATAAAAGTAQRIGSGAPAATLALRCGPGSLLHVALQERPSMASG